jgi:hypothetical protein
VALHTVSVELMQVAEAVTLHTLKFPALHEAQQDPNELFMLWLALGAAYGLAKGWKYRIQAQELLCQVRQEQHLELIADHFKAASLPLPPPPPPKIA